MPAPPDSLIAYPCTFPIKIMGVRQDGFADAICELIRAHDPAFDPGSMEMRPSRHGNYLGLTVTVWALSREQLDGIYLALTRHPMVKVVL